MRGTCIATVAVAFLSLISSDGATLSRRAQLSLVSGRARHALGGEYPLDVLLRAVQTHGADPWTVPAEQLLGGASPTTQEHGAVARIAANLRYCYTADPRPGQATTLARFVYKRTFHEALVV